MARPAGRVRALASDVCTFLPLAQEGGVFERVAQAMRGDADMERLFIDSTIVRAHQHSAAAKKRSIQKIGRSRFGLTTKLDVALDALDTPLRVILSAGQIADIDYAAKTIQHLSAQAIIADKGYDADHSIAKIEAAGMQVVIPPSSNCLTQRSVDRQLYRDRNLIERFFARI